MFDVIHIDLVGLMKTQSIQGNFYHYILVDDYTHYNWVFFIGTKDEPFHCFKTFFTFILTQFGTTLKAIRSDRGGEFLSTDFIKYLEKGTADRLTTPHTPQQNGTAKRANRTIAGAACAMLHSASMTNGFWECAVAIVVHVRN